MDLYENSFKFPTNVSCDWFNLDLIGLYFHIIIPQAMGAPALMTEDQLLTLNEFAKGFTADELSQISFTSNEVIESFGNIRGYTSQQITKLWETIKGGKSMGTFTGDDLVALGVIASGMSTTELNGIDAVAYQ